MRVVSWNINSVRARLSRLLAFLRFHNPDVMCLQETKVSDHGGFPTQQFTAAGYRVVLHGQRNHNGVAILVHDPNLQCDIWAFAAVSRNNVIVNPTKSIYIPTDVQKGFPDDPIPNEARVISACIGKQRLVNVYVVNGEDRHSEQFQLKQRWMATLGKWIQSLPETPPLLVVGDFNVAPDDRDVWDP